MSDVSARTNQLNQIRNVLPHRYPFLLVDRILEVSADGTKAVAIKNVTANEPFFQGHFPDNAIMPGVLIVEALAQSGGLLIAPKVQSEGMVALIASIDGVKLRRPVVPGDQLVMTVESLRVRSRTAEILGLARVGEHLVAEAKVRFVLVEDRR